MSYILSIETATDVCSIAISKSNEMLCLKENTGIKDHASKINILIAECLLESNIDYSDLDAVAVSSGPGSYTGLRIGLSTAKGICFALDIPLISINTLQSMSYGLKIQKLSNNIKSLYQPMIDARRMEVYTEIFDETLTSVKSLSNHIIDASYFNNISKNQILILGGNGSLKVKQFIEDKKNIILYSENIHTASNMIDLAEQKFTKKMFEDMAYYEPNYLKDFIPGKPKVKGLK